MLAPKRRIACALMGAKGWYWPVPAMSLFQLPSTFMEALARVCARRPEPRRLYSSPAVASSSPPGASLV